MKLQDFSGQVRLFRDLAAYREIISYGEGTTSYGIAYRIKTLPNRTEEATLRPVVPGLELTQLKTSSVGTVALTPDVFGLEELLAGEENEFSIDLELSRTREYHAVLVSALISRADIVRRHRGLVLGLLRAVQLAMLHCRMESDRVLEYVRQRYDPELGTRALRRAIVNDLFPASVEIKAGEWQQAMRARVEGARRDYTAEDETTAEDMYGRFAEPYAKLVREEVHRSVLRSPRPADRWRLSYREALLWMLFIGGLTAVTKLLLPPEQRWPYAIGAFAFVLAVGRALEGLVSLDEQPSIHLVFRILGILLAGGAATVAVLPFSGVAAAYGFTFLILGTILAIIIAVMNRRERR